MTPAEALRQQVWQLWHQATLRDDKWAEPQAAAYQKVLDAILALQAEAARPAGERLAEAERILQALVDEYEADDQSEVRKIYRLIEGASTFLRFKEHLSPPPEPASRWEDAADAFAAEPGSRFAQQAPPMTFQHGRHSWCHPGDEPRRHFFLRFADSDMGEQVFNGENAEAEAWAAWDKYAPAWNCYLIAVLAQHDRPAPTPGALADGGESVLEVDYEALAADVKERFPVILDALRKSEIEEDQGHAGRLESDVTGVASRLLGGEQRALWQLQPFGHPVTLLDCPPGPFLFDGHLGFRSEYATTTTRNRYQPDAYVMDSGEYFWGGTSDTLERSQLIVQPLAAKQAPEAPPVSAEADTPHIKKPSPLPVSEALTDEVERLAKASEAVVAALLQHPNGIWTLDGEDPEMLACDLAMAVGEYRGARAALEASAPLGGGEER